MATAAKKENPGAKESPAGREKPAARTPAKAADTRLPKTRIQVSTLRAALRDVSGIVETRNTIPVLSNVLIAVTDQRMTATATDLDIWAVRDCATHDRDPGAADSAAWVRSIRNFAVCLPAKLLEAALAELDGEAMLTIEAPAEVNAEWAGQVTVTAGKTRFRLNALPVTDFPQAPDLASCSGFDMPCGAMADVLSQVDHAICTDEVRYYLNGVFLHPIGGLLRFVATDGHRLAAGAIDEPDGCGGFPTPIMSRKTVAVLEKLLLAAVKSAPENSAPPMVVVETDSEGRRLRFALPAQDGGSIDVIAKTVNGEYPDYTRVIPEKRELRALVDRAELAACVKRVAVLADGKSRMVRVAFSRDLLLISVRTPDVGEASEELACRYDGPGLTLGFDSRFLRQALAAIASDEVALQFDADPAASVRITGWAHEAETSGLLQVLMPMRV